MLDLNHLPSAADVLVLPVTKGAAGQSLTTWQKRRSTQWVWVFALGTGGNGGNGAGGASGYASGAGGGSGGQTCVLVNASMIPDLLYLTQATSTGSALVTFDAAQSTQGILARADAGGNGGNATTTTGGTAGTAGAAATIATMPRAGGGFYTLFAGQAGAAGSSASANSITYPTTGIIVSGGASGGGSFTSSGYTGGAVAYVQTQQLSAAYSNPGGTPSAKQGNDGCSFGPGRVYCGGSGGAGGDSGNNVGGNGGNCLSAYGCGGGGGGGGITAGGTGGIGGSGLIIIAQW